LGEPKLTGELKPMLEVVFPSYLQNEIWALAPIVGRIETTKKNAHLSSKSVRAFGKKKAKAKSP
jgi:hypothetical protein